MLPISQQRNSHTKSLFENIKFFYYCETVFALGKNISIISVGSKFLNPWNSKNSQAF